MIKPEDCMRLGRAILSTMRCRKRADFRGELPFSIGYLDSKDVVEFLDHRGVVFAQVTGLRSDDPPRSVEIIGEVADSPTLHFEDGAAVLSYINSVTSRDLVTAGHVIQWDHPTLVEGNMRHFPGALWPVLVDGFGRLWKEEHSISDHLPQAVHRLVCILDLRTLTPGGR